MDESTKENQSEFRFYCVWTKNHTLISYS